jgi:MSHA biogenesis protein MshO
MNPAPFVAPSIAPFAPSARGRGPRRGPARGVTLVELVVTLSLLGLVAAVGARLISSLTSSQRDGTDRMALSGAADAALRRLTREAQSALPNSLRRANAGGGVFLELVPVRDGGRLRTAIDTTAGGPGDPFNISDPADTGFDVLGPPITAAVAGSWLVVNNLGDDLADAYLGTNRRVLAALPAGGAQVSFTGNGQPLPDVASSRRFFIVASPVTFACEPLTLPDGQAGFRLWRLSGYGWQTSQPTDLASGALAGATRALVLEPLAGCELNYSAALANIGLLTARLVMWGDSRARLPLLAQIPVDNTP